MLSWSTYEKEMLAVVKAVRKWRHYLLGRPFVVKTDHMSLKYLLEQRLTTLAQAQWLPKLLGYDYKIEYKKGVSPPYYSGLPSSLPGNSQKGVVLRDGVWFRERAILVSPTSPLLSTVSEMCHSSPEGGHFGFHQTLAKVKQNFVEGLPNSNGFTAVMVVVDRLSKYAHFVPLRHPFTAATITQEFVANIVCLHGVPLTVVVYSRTPLKLIPNVPSMTNVQTIDEYLHDRDKLLRQLHVNLLAEQHRMKIQANHHRRDFEFETYLSQRHRQGSQKLLEDILISLDGYQLAGNSISPEGATKGDLSCLYQDSDSDVKVDERTSNEFMDDLNVEYHERALLEN
ncbi:transposon ty3-G gag-pol polyprotein [Tanacetum coccineum]